MRHGLTAETVIAALEDAEDYQAFEAAVIADYDAETAVERELVLRLASVLWRLRRATGIETALFELAVEGRSEPKHRSSGERLGRSRRPSQSTISLCCERSPHPASQRQASLAPTRRRISPDCFLRLMEQPTFAFDRLSRYEHVLWRQARQIVFTLESLRRRARRAEPIEAFHSRHDD